MSLRLRLGSEGLKFAIFYSLKEYILNSLSTSRLCGNSRFQIELNGSGEKRRTFYIYVIYLYHCLFIRGHNSSLLYKKCKQSENKEDSNKDAFTYRIVFNFSNFRLGIRKFRK